jgi:hypothetical protein
MRVSVTVVQSPVDGKQDRASRDDGEKGGKNPARWQQVEPGEFVALLAVNEQEFFGNGLNPFCDIEKAFFMILPGSDRLSIGRQHVKFPKRRSFPDDAA